MFDSFLFDSSKDLLWIFLMSLLIYPSLVFILRVFGKRTLTNVNMFDFIITVAYGNVLSSIIITKSISYADGVLVLFMLTALQMILSKLQVKFAFFANLIKAKPVFLYYQGEFNEEIIKREKFRKEDLRQALRKNGMTSFEQAEALILEGDGTISAMEKRENSSNDALVDVRWNR
ncbi:DUF421 domain-containing protein [Bacillus suaedae]|uniref:DUF421 domain-containing protein n=1 Tax=Halalkalibacter suaedae TaxID=2822140 RepID=A0A940X033_9BACI|nr:YetF domain-containing protein [Bacillus suaedae]MBP3952260.1 DUF421 domain-containing protein [Bacillus suaedae]